ncbi:sigma 54-interacting transcriptional regulator [Enterococcus sp. AZ196]|uniref:sigma 54-interacting transcriptional regulator n=1 Tax=Enterococcus sp. AZ196 TaxID=2774659 RepID=UPI003D2B3A88
MKADTNKERLTAFFYEKKQTFTTKQLTQELEIPRPTVSKLLNELVREGLLVKNDKYPISYQLREPKVEDRCFSDVIGYDGSLLKQIISCKSSVTYPPKGLPLLILGESGVGKSFLAERVFNYAVSTNQIAEDAPFKTLNCADYARNEELLSAALFGYTKGSFTGADTNRTGIFDEANGGYLFLDEVHRLSPVGQEKLFRYLDKGVISSLGSQKEREVDVRLIFATTELSSVLLETFIRRIPLLLNLPRYAERPVEERYRIIYQLFAKECQAIGQNVEISSNLYNLLIMFDGKGNIGTLKNIIRVSLARAVHDQTGEQLRVSTQEVPNAYRIHRTNYRFVPKDILIESSSTHRYEQPMDKLKAFPEKKLEELISLLIKQNTLENNQREVREMILELMKDIEKFEESPHNVIIFHSPIGNILEYLELNYGFKFSKRHVLFFSKMLSQVDHHLIDHLEIENHRKGLRVIKRNYYKIYKMSKVFVEMIRIHLDIESLGDYFLLVAFFYFYYHATANQQLPFLVIISHGVSTASSIASLVNQAYSQYIFEGIDMPYNATKDQVLRKLRKSLKNIDTSKGILVLVDMGSLIEIIDDIQEEVSGEIAIMNNITSQVALEAANLILQKKSIEETLQHLEENVQVISKYVPSKEKNSLVIVACSTGKGSAYKISKVLKKCFVNEGVVYQCSDFRTLTQPEEMKRLKEKYKRILLITTSKNQTSQEGITLQELINDKGEQVLRSFYKNQITEGQLQQILDRITKEFTLRNLIEQLTILNPAKLIDDVQEFITAIELEFGKVYTSSEKKILLMHVSIMIERLLLENEQQKCNTPSEKCNSIQGQIVKKKLSVIEGKYNVRVHAKELNLLLNLL